MSQIIPIVSEALQSSIRRLLPSQNGFGEDLQASNTIVPIIDLTPTAEGSILPDDLQTAMSFGDLSAFDATNATATITATPGFFRVFGFLSGQSSSGAGFSGKITASDGLSIKTVYDVDTASTAGAVGYINGFDFIFFVANGITLSAVSNNTSTKIRGSSYQVADINGNLNNPAGFVSQ